MKISIEIDTEKTKDLEELKKAYDEANKKLANLAHYIRTCCKHKHTISKS